MNENNGHCSSYCPYVFDVATSKAVAASLATAVWNGRIGKINALFLLVGKYSTPDDLSIISRGQSKIRKLRWPEFALFVLRADDRQAGLTVVLY
jgi:hypothetical protein